MAVYYQMVLRQMKADVTDDVESQLDIGCEDIFLSYSELYGKYGSNMIHAEYSDLASIYENGKFAIIVATYDSIDPEKLRITQPNTVFRMKKTFFE